MILLVEDNPDDEALTRRALVLTSSREERDVVPASGALREWLLRAHGRVSIGTPE